MPKLRRGRSGHKMVVTNGKLMVGKKNLDGDDNGWFEKRDGRDERKVNGW